MYVPCTNAPTRLPSRSAPYGELHRFQSTIRIANNVHILQASLSLDSTDKDKPTSPPVKSPPGRPGAPRGPPPPGRRGPPPPGHRSMGSRERRPNGPPGPNSPPRRMASSSGSGRPSRPLTDEEQKARDQRRRERERRDPKGKKMKSHRDADLIDKLDETNPFGGRVRKCALSLAMLLT